MLMSALQYKTTVYIVSTSVDTGDATYLDNYLVLCQPVFFLKFLFVVLLYIGGHCLPSTPVIIITAIADSLQENSLFCL